MAKKTNNQKAVPTQIEQPQQETKQLSNEFDELVKAALKLVIANKRRYTIFTTKDAVIHSIALLLPSLPDRKVIEDVVKKELKIVPLHVNDKTVELVVLYNSIEELLDAMKQGRLIDKTTIFDENIAYILHKSNKS
jgi:hypothetical protein